MTWIELKRYFTSLTGLSEDALHIYVALLIQLGAAFLLRRSLAHPLPLVLVLLAVILNEMGDIYFPGNPLESWQIYGAIKDLWNTMLAPFVLLLMSRFCPEVFRPPAATSPPGQSDISDSVSGAPDTIAPPDPERQGHHGI